MMSLGLVVFLGRLGFGLGFVGEAEGKAGSPKVDDGCTN